MQCNCVSMSWQSNVSFVFAWAGTLSLFSSDNPFLFTIIIAPSGYDDFWFTCLHRLQEVMSSFHTIVHKPTLSWFLDFLYLRLSTEFWLCWFANYYDCCLLFVYLYGLKYVFCLFTKSVGGLFCLTTDSAKFGQNKVNTTWLFRTDYFLFANSRFCYLVSCMLEISWRCRCRINFSQVELQYRFFEIPSIYSKKF